jgi:hypothetical protein
MYLSVYWVYGECRVVCSSQNPPNTRKESMRTWRRRKETFGVFWEYAKIHKRVYIIVNNNTNFDLLKILFVYIIWNGLSQKTISRYCPLSLLHAVIHLQARRLACTVRGSPGSRNIVHLMSARWALSVVRPSISPTYVDMSVWGEGEGYYIHRHEPPENW